MRLNKYLPGKNLRAVVIPTRKPLDTLDTPPARLQQTAADRIPAGQKFAVVIPTRELPDPLPESFTKAEEVEERETRVEGIQFVLKGGLIYFQDELDGRLRLCIPKKLEQKITL